MFLCTALLIKEIVIIPTPLPDNFMLYSLFHQSLSEPHQY